MKKLPKGCPKMAHWGSVGMTNGSKSVPEIHTHNGEHWNAKGYNLTPIEIHPDGTGAELSTLRAESERMRDALELIANQGCSKFIDCKSYMTATFGKYQACPNCRARAALSPRGQEGEG